ncbi:MAG: hypothetical protein ABSA57_13005 [Candidatus Acidiferrales bacterium]|jgi:hypothetical protein
MAWTTAIIVVSLWLVGITTSTTFYGYLHVLSAVAIAIAVTPVFMGTYRSRD